MKKKAASVLDASERNDLAVMEIPSANLGHYHALGQGRSSDLRIGEELMTIGHPIGESHHISVGFYTGRFTLDDRTLLRMSMPVDPGNSGGPLFNRRGEVVGVVSQKRSESNIAYAFPIEKINQFAN